MTIRLLLCAVAALLCIRSTAETWDIARLLLGTCFSTGDLFFLCCCDRNESVVTETCAARRARGCCQALKHACPSRGAARRNYYNQALNVSLPWEATPVVFVRDIRGYSPAETEALCLVLPALYPVVPAGEVPLAQLLKRGWMPSGGDGSDSTRFYPVREQLWSDLYMHSGVSPYEGLQIKDTHRPLFDAFPSNAYEDRYIMIDKIRAELRGEPVRLAIEVGSFIGFGAVGVWGPLAQADGGLCICVDTWLGDATMRKEPFYKAYMDLEHGFPKLNEIFLQRVLAEGMQDTIFPLQLPGTTAARMIYLLGYKVDVIYVDSAHERGDTLAELHLYWQLLRPGGLLLGDDYYGFPAVRHDVRAFATCNGVAIDTFYGEQWLVRKPLPL
mmetsp:Transcript_46127/g.93007  ORF Transcript_46127/g.93007 Transcript_46127/m.93007 type:complete len:386 (+) Transcript_46127:49-1206(+)